MSASLVGSEMCIRDSLKSVSDLALRSSEWRVPAAGRRSRMRSHFKQPVSYTHLTLPTICSV
eukprot:6263973-Alexandrium_andersonii.AAC.1